MITRYSRPEMRAIWTDENKLRIWLQIELLASEALVKEGVVPAKDFAKIKAGCDSWFADLPGLVARQRELEKVLNHDVIGFTTAVAEMINAGSARGPRAARTGPVRADAGAEPTPDALPQRALPSRWFHFGLTSSDVGDTAFAVQMVQSRGHPDRRREAGARRPSPGARRSTSSRPASAAATASTPSRRPSASSSR